LPRSVLPGLVWANLTSVRLPGCSFLHFGFNVSTSPNSCGNPILLDRNVRQAISLSLDCNQLVQIALAGHGQPGSVLLPPAFGDYQLQVPSDEQWNANPDKGTQILDTA